MWRGEIERRESGEEIWREEAWRRVEKRKGKEIVGKGGGLDTQNEE